MPWNQAYLNLSCCSTQIGKGANAKSPTVDQTYRGLGWTLLWSYGQEAYSSGTTGIDPHHWWSRRDEWHRFVPFIGSGVSKAVAGEIYGTLAPIARRFKEELRKALGLENDRDLPTDYPKLIEAWLQYVAKGDYRLLVDRYLGDMAGHPHSEVHARWTRAYPLAREIPYLPLKDYVRLFLSSAPLSYDGARPDGANLVLARMLREGYVRTIITTNFDALLELGAFLVGMSISDGEDLEHHPSRRHRLHDNLSGGTHETLMVLEPVTSTSAIRWTGARTGYLLKIHGGIRHVDHVLCRPLSLSPALTPAPPLTPELMIMIHSRMMGYHENSWQGTLLNEAYQNARLLLIGSSASDVVTFRLVRYAQEQVKSHGKSGFFAAPRTAEDFLRQPPVAAWSYHQPEMTLDALLAGPWPDSLSTAEPLPVAHVKQTELGIKALFALTAARSLARVLDKSGCLDERNHLLHATLDLLSELNQVAGNEPTAPIPDDSPLARITVWLNLFCVALPRWGTLSKAQERSLFLQLEGRIQPLGQWYTLPFLNDDEGRIHYRGPEQSARFNRLLYLALVVSDLLKNAYQGASDWQLEAVEFNFGACLFTDSDNNAHRIFPLYLAPGINLGHLHGIGMASATPTPSGTRLLAVFRDRWDGTSGVSDVEAVKRAAKVTSEHFFATERTSSPIDSPDLHPANNGDDYLHFLRQAWRTRFVLA